MKTLNLYINDKHIATEIESTLQYMNIKPNSIPFINSDLYLFISERNNRKTLRLSMNKSGNTGVTKIISEISATLILRFLVDTIHNFKAIVKVGELINKYNRLIPKTEYTNDIITVITLMRNYTLKDRLIIIDCMLTVDYVKYFESKFGITLKLK